MSENHEVVEAKKNTVEATTNGGVFSSLMVGIVIMAFGFAIGLPWLSSVHDGHQLVSAGVRTVGTVTDVDFAKGRRSSSKILTYSFTSDGGATGEVEDRMRYRKRSDGPREEARENLLGTEKTVFYDPDDLDDAIVEGDTRSYVVPVVFLTIFTVVGGFLTYAVADQAVKDRRKKNLTA